MSETQPGGPDPVEAEFAERSLGDLVAEASQNLSQLVRLEMELAKLEIASDVRKTAKGSGLFIVAAVFGHLVLILASVTLALGIAALGLPMWLAFLIVTVFYLIVAGLLVVFGVRYLRQLKGVPRTTSTMRESIAALRRQHSAVE